MAEGDYLALSELDLKTFLDRFIPSTREAFSYAADQYEYETLIRRELKSLGKRKNSKNLGPLARLRP